MHPAFALCRQRRPAIPIWFATAASWPRLRRRARRRRAAFRRQRRLRAQARPPSVLPASRRRAGRRTVRDRRQQDRAIRFLPGSLPGLLPAGTYRFANAPHDARLAALAFALGGYRFARYRKADAERHQAGAAGRRRWRRPVAHRRRRDAGARPHQHAGERHGPGRAGRRRAQARASGTAPRCECDRRRRSAEREFSADPCGRPRVAARRRG